MSSSVEPSVSSISSSSSRSEGLQSTDDTRLPLSAYLLKQSAGKWKRKRWNQRWFVLDREKGILRYFRHASPVESVPLRQDAHGILVLKQTGVSLVVQGDLPPGVPTPFCFTLLATGQKDVRLCADTKAAFRQWTMALSTVISPLRLDLKMATTKLNLTTMASAFSSDGKVSSSLQVLTSKERVVEMEDVKAENGRRVIKSRQVIEQVPMVQLSAWIGKNKTMLLALNPVIVLVRFGNVSAYCVVVLLANLMCAWLLWSRKPASRIKLVSARLASRSPPIVADESLLFTSLAESSSNSDGSQETSSMKLGSVTSQTSTTAMDDQLPQHVTFSGKIDGVKALAGASLKMCATDSTSGCWMHVDATRFNVRQGPNYRKTKVKAASASALLDLVAVDVYQSDVKVDNIGSIINLSVLKPQTGDLDLFIVNCQVPSYQPSNPLWGDQQGDGIGFSFVTYFAIPPAIREMLNGSDEPPLQAVRLLKDFMQPQSWVSERFKAIGIVVNPEEQQLGRAERRLLETYNGQPILTRPQHKFYRGDGYFEVDVNAHDFNYIARKGLVGVSNHACKMVLDFGFVLEGQDDEELPEQMLGCVRLCQVDVRNAQHLL